MKIIRVCTAALARFLLSAVFLSGAVKNILTWSETERWLMNTLSDWQTYIGYSETAQEILTLVMPWSALLLGIATLCQLSGGLFVLLGMREKLGASLLILFLVPTTIICHAFWFLDGTARELQTIMFLKNLAILGGLLLILLHGGQAKAERDSFSSIKM